MHFSPFLSWHISPKFVLSWKQNILIHCILSVFYLYFKINSSWHRSCKSLSLQNDSSDSHDRCHVTNCQAYFNVIFDVLVYLSWRSRCYLFWKDFIYVVWFSDTSSLAMKGKEIKPLLIDRLGLTLNLVWHVTRIHWTLYCRWIVCESRCFTDRQNR